MNTELNLETMKKDWKKPEIEEIALSCEITSYSNAELPDESPII